MPPMRNYIRHPADVPIHLRVQQAGAAGAERIRNIGVGGLCCTSRVGLAQGVLVRVRIPVREPPFESEGMVVWCRRSNGDFEVGIQFLGQEDAFRARMVEQVCHIEHYRRRVREREGRELSPEQAAREWIEKYAAEFPDSDGD
jgi:hypothetical protein